MNSMIIVLLLTGICLLILLLIKQKKKVNLLNEALQETLEIQEIKEIQANLKGRDQERIRITKDWHDGIGNYLSTLRLLVDTIQPKNPDNHQVFVQLLEDTQIEFRKIIDTELTDNFSTQEKTIATLEKWQRQLFKGNIVLDYKVYGFLHYDNLENQLKTHLYRIAQELMSNVIRHSGANKVSVTLKEKDEALIFSITDNGIGMVPTEGKVAQLRSVKDRVAILNGQLVISSKENKATVIEVFIPILKNTRFIV